MNCSRCSADAVEGGRYCFQCGADVREDLQSGPGRRRSFAAHPGEPVLSFNIMSSLMPLAAGTTPQTYRFALGAGLAVPIVAAALGFLPFAFAAAAVVVPITYLVYLYDVNEWEDQPVPVILGTVALTGALATVFTLIWHRLILDGHVGGFGRAGEIDGSTLLVIGLLVPIVGELIRQIGPVFLASKPRFDDLIDGLTFGVTAGVTFAAFETLVLNSGVILDGAAHVEDPNGSFWVSLIITSALIKPLVYGSATGLAVAAWSGVGAGHDGFKGQYVRGLLEAVGANIAFQVGLFLLGRLEGDLSSVLSVLWGLAVAAVLILRIRVVLHSALLEGALEAAARDSIPASAVHTIGFCGECEMPLVHRASFCTACGTAVRAASKRVRHSNSAAPDKDLIDAYANGATR